MPADPAPPALDLDAKPPTRAETGAMQFGDDWPGVFIRGDNAGHYAMQLQTVLDAAEDVVRDYLAVAVLRGLVSELAGCRVTSAGTPIDTQRMRPFAEATAGADDALRAERAALARVGACVLAHGLSDGDARACAAELRAELAAALAPTARVVAAARAHSAARAKYRAAMRAADEADRAASASGDRAAREASLRAWTPVRVTGDEYTIAADALDAALAALDARDGAR